MTSASDIQLLVQDFMQVFDVGFVTGAFCGIGSGVIASLTRWWYPLAFWVPVFVLWGPWGIAR